MPINTKWFRNKLTDRGMSQRALARKLGLDAAAVSLMLRGRREMRMGEAAEIARLIGVPAEEVLTNAGVRLSSKHKELPITGFVDGTGEAHSTPSKETVPHPGGNVPPNSTALQCKTAGSPLAHMDGWMLFAQDAANSIALDAVGKLSLCKLRDGVIFLAAPHRSYRRGKWDLIGPASTIKGVELEWAVPILLIQP